MFLLPASCSASWRTRSASAASAAAAAASFRARSAFSASLRARSASLACFLRSSSSSRIFCLSADLALATLLEIVNVKHKDLDSIGDQIHTNVFTHRLQSLMQDPIFALSIRHR